MSTKNYEILAKYLTETYETELLSSDKTLLFQHDASRYEIITKIDEMFNEDLYSGGIPENQVEVVIVELFDKDEMRIDFKTKPKEGSSVKKFEAFPFPLALQEENTLDLGLPLALMQAVETIRQIEAHANTLVQGSVLSKFKEKLIKQYIEPFLKNE